MADTVINLSQVVRAVQQDNNVLTDITNICKAINKVSINGLDVATVTSNVNIIKGLSNSIKPILQSLNGLQLELNKVDITNISDLSASLDNIKTISNSVLELVGDFNSDSTELTSKISSITETGAQLASFAAAIYCPALKSGQVARGLLAGLNLLGDGLKANNEMSLDDVMNKQGLNPLLMGSVKAANSILTELVDLDLEEWGDEAMKAMVGDKVSLITAAGSLVKNYSNSLYKNEKTGLLVDLKSLNEVMNKTSDLQNLKPGSFNAIYEQLNEILESLTFDTLHILVADFDFEEINNSYDGVNKILQSTNTIFVAIADMNDPKKNPILSKTFDLSTIKNNIGSTFDSLEDIVVVFGDKFDALHILVADFDFKEINKSYEGVSKIFQSINTILTSVADMNDSNKNNLISKAKDIQKVQGNIKNTLAALVEIIKNIKEDLSSFGDIVDSISIEDINKSYEEVSKIFQSINTILTAINDMVDIKKNPLINPVKLLVVKGAIKRTFNSLVGLMESILNHMEKFEKIVNQLNIEDVTKAYESINSVFKSVSDILKAVNELSILMLKFMIAAPIVIVGLPIVGAMLLGLVGVLKLISLIKFDKNTSKAFEEITNLLKGIENLVKHMVIVALIMIPAIIAATIITLGLLALSGVLWLMGKVVKLAGGKWVAEGRSNINDLIKLMLSISALVLSLILLAIVMQPTIEASISILMGLSVIAIVTFGIALLMWGLSKIVSKIKTSDILKVAGLFIMITIVAVIFLGLAIILVKTQEYAEQIKVGVILAFIGGMIALAVAFAGLGYACSAASAVLLPAMVGILALTGAMLVVLGAFLGMAVILNNIQNTEIDPEVIKNKSLDILNASKDVCLAAVNIAKLITIKEIKTAKKTIKNIRRLVKQVGEIAETLNKVNEIKLDRNLIESNIKVIFLTANQVVSSIGNEDGTGISPETIEKNGSQFKLTLVAFNVIFDDLNKLVKILDDVQKVKLDGKVITDSINVVFQTANEIIEKIVNNENVSLDKLKEDKKEFDKISNQYKAIFKDFAKLTDILTGVDLEKFKNQTNGGFVGIITDIAAASKKLEEVDGEKINKTLNSYGDFLKKVDKVNLKKLETSAKMFEEMAKFSESINGNFDKMADTLNEKIGPLLEDLKNTLNDVHNQVTENGAQAQANSDRIVEKQEIREQMQASGQTQNLTVEEVDRRIDRKYQENVQQRYGIDEIASKLATLIDLFQSGEAVVKTT